jgi:hypothetical protein
MSETNRDKTKTNNQNQILLCPPHSLRSGQALDREDDIILCDVFPTATRWIVPLVKGGDKEDFSRLKEIRANTFLR